MDFWQQNTIDMSDEKDETVDGEAGWIVRPPASHSQELSNLCRRPREGLEVNPNYVATHRQRLSFMYKDELWRREAERAVEETGGRDVNTT